MSIRSEDMTRILDEKIARDYKKEPGFKPLWIKAPKRVQGLTIAAHGDRRPLTRRAAPRRLRTGLMIEQIPNRR